MRNPLDKKQAMKAFLNGTISERQLEYRLKDITSEVRYWVPCGDGRARCDKTGQVFNLEEFKQYEQQLSDLPDIVVIDVVTTAFYPPNRQKTSPQRYSKTAREGMSDR